MRVSLTAAVLAMFGIFPSIAFGLALGDIKLNSALNEPLDAEIEIQAATPDELENLSASIAPRETFERYGLDRPDFLAGLQFSVIRAGGRDILQVRSRQAISEPFVTFLVEAQWRRGRLLREYTVLLDPPVFMPVPESARSPAPAPVYAPRSAPTAQAIERPAPRPAPRRLVTTPVSYSGDYGPIRRGETLWSIAERLRGDSSFSMNQLMVAIYRANQGEFLGNINLVKEGSVLRIPDRASIAALAQPEAFAVAVAHNEAWRAGRPSQVAQVTPAPRPASSATTPEADRLRLVEPDLTSTGALASGGRDDAATRAALARNEAERTRLATENDQLRTDLDEIRRLISLKDANLAELQRQLSAAGQSGPAVSPTADTTDDVTALATVDSAADATAADGGATGAGTAPGTVTADAGTAGSTAAGPDTATPSTTVAQGDDVTATSPGPVVAPGVTTSLPEEKGFIATLIDGAKGLLGSLWLWIGLGVLALAAFAAVFLRGRGAAEPDPLEALTRESSDDTAIVQRPALAAADEDVEFFDDSGTFKPVDFAQAEGETAEYPFEDTIGAGGGIKLDQSDPMAEADFHLAYGLYDQAADLVRKAVAREPARVDLRMKLLEIFFVWGNQEEFRATAKDMRDNMSGQIAGEWDKIVIMGKQICPDDDLFAGGTGMASGADIDLEFDTSPTTSSVDFDTTDTTGATDTTGLADTSGITVGLGAAEDDGGLDLDIGGAAGGAGALAAAGAADVFAEDDDGLDFDLGLELPPADDEDDETRPEPVDALKEQIKARLSSTDDDETAEMDLSDLGVDLDLGTAPVEDDAGGFGDVFGGDVADPTSEMPAPTAELTAGAKGLDLDIGEMFGGLASEEDDETARDLNALEESMETTAPHQAAGGDDTGHFSAEIETLHGEALDVDISGFEEDEHGRTHLINDDLSGDEPTGSHTDDAFSASVFGAVDDDIGETRMLGPDSQPDDEDPLGDVFSVSEDDETVLAEAPDLQHDGLETDLFGLQTGSQPIDLDIGEAMDSGGEDRTTAKVATTDMALPGGDDELSEVGTKLDLARAYMDMGDPDGARGILEEVIAEGDETQQADARGLLEALS